MPVSCNFKFQAAENLANLATFCRYAHAHSVTYGHESQEAVNLHQYSAAYLNDYNSRFEHRYLYPYNDLEIGKNCCYKIPMIMVM